MKDGVREYVLYYSWSQTTKALVLPREDKSFTIGRKRSARLMMWSDLLLLVICSRSPAYREHGRARRVQAAVCFRSCPVSGFWAKASSTGGYSRWFNRRAGKHLCSRDCDELKYVHWNRFPWDENYYLKAIVMFCIVVCVSPLPPPPANESLLIYTAERQQVLSHISWSIKSPASPSLLILV